MVFAVVEGKFSLSAVYFEFHIQGRPEAALKAFGHLLCASSSSFFFN